MTTGDENVTGATIIGDEGDNDLPGGPGDDYIDGRGGSDWLTGGACQATRRFNPLTTSGIDPLG